ncbi:MAG TPA: DNA polymerase III subunit beta [Campylobacterales bacterium]|nr:DNA polymerase III subunit beta [Campylobacterales bacterium]
MNIEINKNVLEHMLINAQSFLEKKDASQITSHILLNATGLNLKVKATDFEIGLIMESTNVNIIEQGLSCANGKKLLDIVKILKDEMISLKTEDDFLHIKQKRSKFKLPMFNAEEFPEFPSTENKSQFDIKAIDFLHSIKKISPAIDTNNPKYELNGALIDIVDNAIKFVATDTRRLAVVTLQKNVEFDISLIIPKKAIGEIQKLFFDEMNIYYDENVLIVKSENFTFFTKLINGKYPDYQRIIPKEHKVELTLNREQIVDHLKQVSTISYEMKITFSNEAITFESLNEDNIEAKTQLEFQSNLNEEISIAVNSKYILDFLSQIEKNEFKLRYNDSTLPFMLESEGFITVIMPIMQ